MQTCVRLSPWLVLWLAMPALLGVGGCTSTGTIDVTRRTSLPTTPKGAPFIVLLSKDEENQSDYTLYAQNVVTQLETYGLAAAQDASKARFAVMFARTWPHQVEEAGEPADTGGHGQDGGMGEGMGGGMGHGLGGAGGGGGFGHHHGGSTSSASESRDASLQIAVFDLTKPRSPEERVFYAKARVPIGRDESDQAIDDLISAALKDFPGKPRESYSIAQSKESAISRQ